MRASRLTALVAAAITLPAIHARADDTGTASAPLVYGYVEVTSNYVSRGLSQTIGRPSTQVEIDVNPGPGLYANFSVANVDWVDVVYPGADAPVEVAGAIAYRALAGPGVTIESGALRVQYPGHYPRASTAPRPDTTELFGSVRWRWLRAKLNYSATDSFGFADSRGSWYLDLSAATPLSATWAVGAHVGRSHASGTDPSSGKRYASEFSYTDYRLVATHYFGAGLSFALACTWTNADARAFALDGYNTGGRQIVAMIEKDF